MSSPAFSWTAFHTVHRLAQPAERRCSHASRLIPLRVLVFLVLCGYARVGQSATTCPVRKLSSAASTMRRLFTASCMCSERSRSPLDRAQQIGLLAVAEALMVGFVLGADELVGLHELVVRVERAVVQAEQLVFVWLSMSSEPVAAASFGSFDDRHAALAARSRPSRRRPPRSSSVPSPPRTSRPIRLRRRPAAGRSCTCRAGARR